MEDTGGTRPNKLHHIQQTLGQAQGMTSKDGSPKKRRSMIDSALSTPRHGTTNKHGGGGKPRSNGNDDDTKRRRKGGPRSGGRGGRGTLSSNKNGGGRGGKSGGKGALAREITGL